MITARQMVAVDEAKRQAKPAMDTAIAPSVNDTL